MLRKWYVSQEKRNPFLFSPSHDFLVGYEGTWGLCNIERTFKETLSLLAKEGGDADTYCLLPLPLPILTNFFIPKETERHVVPSLGLGWATQTYRKTGWRHCRIRSGWTRKWWPSFAWLACCHNHLQQQQKSQWWTTKKAEHA